MKIGIARVKYTPPTGLPLMGNYRGVDYAARGIHDPLHARAVVLAGSSGAKAALLSVDICMIDRGGVAIMREFIAFECDITAENILIAATHTHSAAAPMSLCRVLPTSDDASTEEFLKKAATAIMEANEKLEDASLAIGYNTEDRVSFNRRLKCRDGETHMNWEELEPDFVIEPLGPIDPQVITLSIQQQGKPKACIVNFALHPAVLAGDNWLYSADYPGYLCEAAAKFHDPDFTTLFFNGCCGNVNHIDYTNPLQGRGYKMTQRIGYMLAASAAEAMRGSVAVAGDEIAVSREKVALKRLPITEEQRKWSEDVMEKSGGNPVAEQVDGLPDEHYAATWLDMYEKQNTDDHVEVMVIRIGDVGIVGIPGEIFCEFGMDIKKRSPARYTLVIELANDAIGYIPMVEAFDQGGYESTCGNTFYVEGVGERLVSSALSQLKKLFQKQEV